MHFLPDPIDPAVSRTALMVCAYCALTARHPAFAKAFRDPFAEPLYRLAAREGDALMERTPDWPAVERVVLAEGGVAATALTSVVWRKRWIEDHARRALEDGIRRVVVLGGGLDTLALRLAPAFPAASFIEVDRTETQRVKRRLAAQVAGIPDNLAFVEADLAITPLEAVLSESSGPTLLIAEFVLEYLPPEAVARLFGSFRPLIGAQGRLIFTFMSKPSLETEPLARRYAEAAEAIGEPIRWRLDPALLSGFLRDHGLRARDRLNTRVLIDSYLDRIGINVPGVVPERPVDTLHMVLASANHPSPSRSAGPSLSHKGRR
ncbi:class I SAM-dependent methyltransferase [Inquilinus sp. CAU 1745]|uniref:class I SAM-dependent methyltransferase n=1 Tax=Inquilinus sp. CAU 1745 TaxID=3140369 RepID=UPI00325AD0A7